MQNAGQRILGNENQNMSPDLAKQKSKMNKLNNMGTDYLSRGSKIDNSTYEKM